MSKNYEIMHYIQSQMIGMDEKLTNTIVRMLNRLESRGSYAAALSTSVTLFLAMKFLELNPKLILGTIQFQGLSYPHAWLELDEKIYDLATYIDVQHHPVLKEKDLTAVNPMINITYEDAAEEIRYYPFQFGDLWPIANMKRLVGKTFETYVNDSPYVDILADVCYILEEPEIPENLDFFMAVAKVEVIRDTEN